MIRMIPQPIVKLSSRQVVMEEWLCRPHHGTVEEFFQTTDKDELWTRESLCLQKAICMKSQVPKSLNLSLSSMPFFLQTDWTWDGYIEIVEWGVANSNDIGYFIGELRKRGLKVLLDDLSPTQWLNWIDINVDGYKIAFDILMNDRRFVQEVLQKNKLIIAEMIETQDMENLLKELGLQFGQGFYYQTEGIIVKGYEQNSHE